VSECLLCSHVVEPVGGGSGVSVWPGGGQARSGRCLCGIWSKVWCGSGDFVVRSMCLTSGVVASCFCGGVGSLGFGGRGGCLG